MSHPAKFAPDAALTKEQLEVMLLGIHNIPLYEAAEKGDLEAMRAAKDAGAVTYDRAAMHAASHGQLQALVLLREWGFADLKAAACSAARRHHIGIVQQCRDWGLSTCIEHVFYAAASAGDVPIMELCWGWANADRAHLNSSMGIAAGNGHEAAVRRCAAWGADGYALARLYATNAGHPHVLSVLDELEAQRVPANHEAKK